MKNKKIILYTLVLLSVVAIFLYVTQTDKKDTMVSNTDIPEVENTDTTTPQVPNDTSTPSPVITSPALTDIKANTFGTTAGNLMNWGAITSQGNWMYSVGNSAIVRTMLDGETAYKQLTKYSSEGGPANLNVVGDWVYYTNSLYNNEIFRIKLDRSKIEQLTHETAMQMCIIKDYIYFTNPGGLKKIKIDGSELITIYSLDGETAFFSFDENYLYLLVEPFNNNPATSHVRGINNARLTKLYRMNYDGSDIKLLTEKDSLASFIPYENYIYYINTKDQSLYKMKNDGTKKVKLLNESINTFNISEDSIFYTIYPESKKIYKVDLEGKKKSEITKNLEVTEFEYIIQFSIIGDSIYFYTHHYRRGLALIRIKKDGSLIKYIQ
jgi:hypothetical protein